MTDQTGTGGVAHRAVAAGLVLLGTAACAQLGPLANPGGSSGAVRPAVGPPLASGEAAARGETRESGESGGPGPSDDEAPKPDASAPSGLVLPGVESIEFNVYANGIGRKDDKSFPDEDGNELGDRARLREVDLDLRATLLDGVEAVIILALFSDPVSEYRAAVEQGYVEIRAPWLADDSPWVVDLRLGKIRSTFGSGNELRIFEIPQPTRPPSLEEYLGWNGYRNVGGSLRGGWESDECASTVTATLELLNNGDVPLANTDGDEAFATMFSLDWTQDLGCDTTLRAGVSAWEGKQEDATSRRAALFGADVLLGHVPEDPGAAGAWHCGGEVFRARVDRSGTDVRPSGFYVWGQYEVLADWFLGARYDYHEDHDNLARMRQYGAYVTYVVSDLLRFSAGYEFTESDTAARFDANTILLELNYAFGTGPRPPFWARR